MQFEFYLLLFGVDVLLFFMGFFGVPKMDRNTRLTLMAITMFLSFALVMASFQIGVTTCTAATNTTCTDTVNYVYDCQLTKCVNWTYDLMNETHTTTCSAAGLDCITNTYQEMELVGFFLLLAVLSLIYVIMEYLGYLPTEISHGGFEGAERHAPDKFGQA